MSLRLRVLEVALLPLLLAVGLFASYFTHRTVVAAEEELMDHGVVATSNLSASLAFDLFSGNLASIHKILGNEYRAYEAEAIGIVERGVWLVYSGDAQVLADQNSMQPPAVWEHGHSIYFSRPMQQPSPTDGDPYLAPPGAETRQAYVVVAFNHDHVSEERNQVIIAASGVGILSIMLAMVLAWRIASRVSQPIIDLTRGVSRLADGALAERVVENAAGEIGQLQRSVNRMAQTLEANQQQLQQRVEEATSELMGQKTAAEAAVLSKSRFLAAASHDLRQPLHALSLLVEALKERVRGEEARHLVDNIEASTGAMQNLLNSLLDLSRLEAGVVEARPECLPVMQVLEQIEQQFAPMAAEKGIKLRVHRSKLWIYHDPALLVRIISNLVSNALRYTERGGVLVGFRRVQADWVRLEVRDTGQGIPAQYHDRIFEEYFQLENPERHRDKGLGLGLAIVSRLSQLLGGHVEVRSQTGHGSCFRLGIPRCPAPSTAIQVSAPQPAYTLPLQDALVAVIDDDQAILEAMVAMFDQWGIPLAAGEDAEQVRGDLKELGRTPSVILSDYRLREGRTGIEAIALLRATFGATIPAALLTGDTATDTIASIDASGLPILHKPFKPAKLRAFLAHLMATPVDPK